MRRRGGRSRAAARAWVAARRAFLLTGAFTAVVGVLVATPLPPAAGEAGLRSGVPFNGTAAVGALFTSSDGRIGAHFCTAAVVSSPAGNLLITAAHCMQGKSLNPAGSIVFAPGYHNGAFPLGLWVVTTSYVDSEWADHQNPDDDVAFLVVGSPGTDIQRLTGAEILKVGQPAQVVRTIGYPNSANQPITCTAPAQDSNLAHQMVFACDGYTEGTSGSPFLAHVNPRSGDGWVIGVIGGYQEGGYTPDVSYSPRFFSAVAALYQAAVSGSG